MKKAMSNYDYKYIQDMRPIYEKTKQLKLTKKIYI